MKSQTLDEQRGVAWAGAGQALLQAPQCSTSVLVDTHWPPQSVWLPVQLAPHTPLEQTCPVAQALPQAPQFAVLVWRFTHCPAHSLKPGSHATLHAPAAQAAAPLGGAGQTLAQEPQ